MILKRNEFVLKNKKANVLLFTFCNRDGPSLLRTQDIHDELIALSSH